MGFSRDRLCELLSHDCDQCQTRDSFKGGRLGFFYFLEGSAVHQGEEGRAREVPWSSVANQEAERERHGEALLVLTFLPF